MSHILAVTNKSIQHAIVNSLDWDGGPLYNFNIAHCIEKEHVWVGPRSVLEGEETYRQVIPYVLITNQLDQILVYRRTNKGGEARLHGNHSIGFGGHIDICDVVFNDDGDIRLSQSIERATARELEEEIGISSGELHSNMHGRIFGTIVDDSNEVGRVHAGAVDSYLYIGNKEIYAAEDHIEVMGFKDINEVLKMADDNLFESWSNIIINTRLRRNDK